MNVSTREQLEERKRSLEETLRTKRKRLEEVGAGSQEARGLEAAIAETEKGLTSTIYQIECLQHDWRYALPPGEPIRVDAYYATNRKRAASAQAPGEVYGAEQVFDAPEYGRVVVTMPAERQPGTIERPSWWKLELEGERRRGYWLAGVTPLDHAFAMRELAERASMASRKALLLFVHGFNSTFPETAIRTAQLAYDLRFPGVVMFFSWPASGNYSRDEETVEIARKPFGVVLDDLARLPYEEVYVIAHSMGTRLAVKELADRRQKGADVGKIRELLLAAPDINAEIFKYQIAPAFAELQTMRRTIYASSNDVALKVSRSLRGYRRVGETADGVLVFPGFETVDSTAAAPMLRAYGHSYVFDSVAVLKDVELAVVGRLDQASRGLTRAGTAPDLYWVLSGR